jgi:tripeptidyl-peptidase I
MHSKALPSHQIEFKLALKQENVEKLHALAYAISDPDSKHYGKHLTNQQISSMIGAPASRIERVEAWLNGSRTKTRHSLLR